MLEISNIKKYVARYTSANKLVLVLIISAVALLIFTYRSITKEYTGLTPDPSKVIGLILADLIIFLTLAIILANKFFRNFFDEKNNRKSSKLQNRIIIAFSLVAVVPIIIVSVFSVYFFNFGIQSWFDQKLSAVLDQSIIVAESYIAEHTIQLKETSLSVADDLNEMYYELIHNPELFAKTLNGEAELRSLDEAIVFQRNTNRILAQTVLSFSLSFTSIPIYLIEKANKGEPIEIKSDPTKIRMLIKLREYNDTYLLIGRLIDNKIIDHVDKTNGAAAEYYRLKKRISSMQIKFSIVFIILALLLVFAAISWAVIFANQIVSPIRKLVNATEQVKDGDLTIQVSEEKLHKDEIRVLTTAFNRMIKQINRQQQDLLIAQRALAWSDVARRVAHEIKNPLTPIQLSAERLLKKFENEVVDREAFQKYIQTIVRHTNDIKKIVSEFVNFARLPAPTFTKCKIVTLVKDIVESRKLINEKIIYEFVSNEEEIELVADSTQLNQVMVNLLKNAEESLVSNEIQPKIQIFITKTKDLIYITIIDNGIGFPSDIINKATEPYITNKLKGTGLGLAIVKKIIQDHLGLIEISNAKMRGAIVKLIFNHEELKSKLK